MVQSYVLKNTVTNYLLVFLRLIEGLLLTRWLYFFLGKEFYGFWALLWSVFVYALLLDFGYSKAAQKYTAQRLFEENPKEYNQIISAVFALHAVMTILILLGTVLGEQYLSDLTGIKDPEQLAYCALCLKIFGIGAALTFPLGMFAEILVGLHKLYLRNYVQLATRLLELIGIGMLLFFGYRLLSLVIFSVVLNLTSSIVMLFLAHHEIPVLKIRPKFTFAVLKKLADFSFYIYLISIANLVIGKTDRLILSIFTGLGPVGTYQLGTRLPEIAQNMTTQYQENISPIAAALHEKKDEKELQAVIFTAMRFASFIVTPLTLYAFLMTPEILGVLFKVKDAMVNEVCRYMLVSTYIFVAFRSVASRFLMMSGRHRLLAGIQISDAVINLALSLILVRQFGILGVIWGTLIPNAFLSFFIILPYMYLFLKQEIAILLFRVYIVPMIGAIPGVAAIFILRRIHPLFTWNFFGFCFAGGTALLSYLLIMYFCGLNEKEQKVLNEKLSGMIKFYK